MKKIAVITRTKDRPIFLRRCADDLIKQQFRDLLWVIVNDGGQSSHVDEIAAYARENGIDCFAIHLTQNVGIAEAANTGIKQSSSEYIHLHDDDDTVEPNFYSIMCGYLDSDIKKRFGGVVCSTYRVDECVRENHIQQTSKQPLHHSKSATHIADIITRNQFSTISFIFRRNCIETIGYYDRELTVLEDWDFNIRFLMQFDIASIYDHLANYHFRSIATGPLAQTVQSSIQHEIYTAVLRNKYFRNGLKSDGNAMLGLLTNIGRNFQIQTGKLTEIQNHIESEWTLKRFLKKCTRKLNHITNRHKITK